MSRELQPRSCVQYSSSKGTSWQQSVSACPSTNSTHSTYFLLPFLTGTMERYVKSTNTGHYLRILVMGTGGMAQQLKAHAVLTEDPLAPSVHISKVMTAWNISLTLPSGLYGHLHSCAQKHRCILEPVLT